MNDLHTSAPPGERSIGTPVVTLQSSPPLPTSLMGLLRQAVRLDVYGSRGLGTRAQIAMARGALMLLLVFGFDLAAWSLLFNMIFNRGEMQLSWMTLPAVGLAAVLSIATQLFEANLFTADLSRWWSPKMLTGLGARLSLVIGGAFMTALPLHILLFDGPIQIRALEEDARTYAVRFASDAIRERKLLTELETGERETLEKALLDRREASLLDQKEHLTELRQARGGLKARLESAKADEASAARRISRARRALAEAEAADKESAQLRLDRAYGSRRAAAQRVATLQAELGELNGQVEASELERAESSEDVDKATTALFAQHELERTRAQALERAQAEFIRRLLAATPGEPLTYSDDASGQTFHYSPPARSFDARQKILHSLMAGERPRWPDVVLSAEELAYIDTRLKLPYQEPAADTVEHAQWEANTARLMREGEALAHTHSLTLFIGMVVPLLAFLFKLMVPRELSLYYSVRHQAQVLHNPEARAADSEQAEEDLLDRLLRWLDTRTGAAEAGFSQAGAPAASHADDLELDFGSEDTVDIPRESPRTTSEASAAPEESSRAATSETTLLPRRRQARLAGH